jgi:hypothetical protein
VAPKDAVLLAEARKLVPAEDLQKMESYQKRLYHTKGQGSGLGNEELGDGKRFAGRGPIQLTGRDNYTRASKQLGLGDKLAKNPELVADDVSIGMLTTVWFWNSHSGIQDAVALLRGYVFPKDPKVLQEKERAAFNRVSRIINGSYRPGKVDKPANGEEERWKYYKQMVETFWYTRELGDFGGGLTVLLSQLSPRLIDVPDLREVTGLPVLGAVSLSASPGHRRQRRYELLAFSAGLAGLLLVYAAQVTLFLLDINVHGRLQHVLGALK